MYAALWRILPGARWVKILTLVVMLIAVLSVAVEWVFPWVAATFIQPDTVVEP
ncbi:MAG: hypothetical protein RLZZ587_274 [Actinomycetota bacterium]